MVVDSTRAVQLAGASVRLVLFEGTTANDHPFDFLFIRTINEVVAAGCNLKAGGAEFGLHQVGCDDVVLRLVGARSSSRFERHVVDDYKPATRLE